jgi:hypothetical protein
LIVHCRFEQPEAAKAAIDSMNGFDLGGRQLKVIQIALTFSGSSGRFRDVPGRTLDHVFSDVLAERISEFCKSHFSGV